MPLIRVEPEGKPVLHRIKLDPATSTELNLYCAFIANSSESSVIRAVLKHVFTADEDFVLWKKDPNNLAKSQPRARRSKNHPNGSDPASATPAASAPASQTPTSPGAKK